MALAPERTGIGIRRHFTAEGRTRTTTSCGSGATPGSPTTATASVAFEQLGVEVPGRVVAQRHQHPRPEVLPGHARHARARVVAAPGGRPGGRHHHRLGLSGRLLRRRRRGRGVPRRAQVPHRHPEGGVQLAGVVQHRRAGRAPAGVACFILSVDDSMDSILNWYVEEGTIFKGGSGVGHQPVPHPLVARAPQGRRHRLGPGQLHAGRRRLGRHHQVRGQDPAGGEDGHPQRRPPRHRGLHLVQGGRGAQGPRAARRRLRHGPRRQGQPLDPVPERQQLGAGHRRVHAGGRGRRRLAPPRRHHRRGRPDGQGPRPVPPDRPGGVGVRRPRHAVRHHDQPLAHGGHHRAASTGRTRAASTCTSTTRPATWPASTCCRSSTTTADRFDVDGFSARRRGRVHRPGDPRRQRRLPHRGDRRDVPPLPPARASATPTSAPCSWPSACPTTPTAAGPGPAPSPPS